MSLNLLTKYSKSIYKATLSHYNNIKISIGILFITLITHLPSLTHGFLNWDDNTYITSNPSFKANWLEFTQWAFYTKYFANYHPLTWLSYKLDYEIWGLNPFGYHLTNIIFHSLNSILVFFIIKTLIDMYRSEMQTSQNHKKTLIISLTTTALFMLHPIHIESVTWVSERKDVLYAFFYLISIYFYCKYLKSPKTGSKHYITALLFFLFSSLSKVMAVTLPVVLIIIDLCINRRLYKDSTLHSLTRIMIEKIPFLSISIIFSIIAVKAQNISDSIISIESFSYSERIISYIFTMPLYVLKLIVPLQYTHLHPLIPYKEYMSLTSPFFIAMFVLFLIATIFVVLRAKKHDFVPTAIYTFFLITILPTSSLFHIAYRLFAERYLYLASIAIFLTFSILLYNLFYLRHKKVFYTLFGSIFLILTFATIKQQSIWKDTLTLWNHQIKVYGHIDTTGYYLRGLEYIRIDQCHNAIMDFNKVLQLKTHQDFAYRNRGFCYTKLGEHQKAIDDNKKVVEMLPDKSKSYFDLAMTYYKAKDYKNAKANFTIAKKMGDEVAVEVLKLIDAEENNEIKQTNN